MITVMFPSRGRPESLVSSIQSLRETAAQTLDVQFIVAADPDDWPTAHAAGALAGAALWWGTERFGYSRQQHYYNGMLPLARGEILMLWGDDARMQTEDWNVIITAQFLERDCVMWPESNGYPYCFPVVPARWARALGRFSPSAHPDSYWYSVGKGLDRHVEIPVSVWHDRKDLTGGHDDATYAEGRGRLGQDGMADDGGGELVARDVEVIRRLL